VADYVFGPFVLSTDPARLTRDGIDVRLRPRAFEALRVLLQHQGTVVSYETLIEKAWDGTHISWHTIDVTMTAIRQCLEEYEPWLVHRSKSGYSLAVPASDALVRQGWHFWRQRTRTGCERAIECFTRAIAESPTFARAFEGLSASYLALAVFGMRSPLEMYPRFLDAHRRAESLSGLRPELRCNRAFALNLFEHRPDESEAEFVRVLHDKPSLATTYVRLSMLYGSQGRFDEALAILDRGKMSDPLLPTLAATDILIHCWRRDFDTAVSLGQQAIELHPHLQVVRVNYGQALQLAGRVDEALAQYQIASILSPDVLWLRALEGSCHALLGRRRDARAMLEGLETVRQSEYVDAYYMSVFRSALGQPRDALAELERAFTENSAWLYALDVDPRFDTIRTEPGFRRLHQRLRRNEARPRRSSAGP